MAFRLGGALLLVVAALGCGDDAGPSWKLIHEELDGALMSVWAESPTDVWAVGADPGDGPQVLHYDGTGWQQLATGATGDLWWVHGFAGGPVYMGGEGGLILRYDGGSFETMTTPGTGNVFGLWGTSPSDMWAVGGNLGGASGAFAWRYDGDGWGLASAFPSDLAQTDAVWKVFGLAANDVWLVGTNGLILHWDGDGFTRDDAGASVGLFTVHGTADRMVAVGGFGTGALLERGAGGSWRDASPELAPQLIGVHESAGDGYAVGLDGAVFRRAAGTDVWEYEPTNTGASLPLHAVAIDGEGGVWAVGGQVLAAPFVSGTLLYRGPDEIPRGF